MELKERIKKARKEAGYKSQEKLAEVLGTTRNAITEYEMGRVIPNDVFLQLMATKLHISYEWLKEGKGDMKAVSDVEAFAREYNLSPLETAAARYIFQLSSQEREKLLTHVMAMGEVLKAAKAAPAAEPEESAKNATTIEESLTVAKQSYQIEVTPEEYANLMRDRAAYEAEKGEAG